MIKRQWLLQILIASFFCSSSNVVSLKVSSAASDVHIYNDRIRHFTLLRRSKSTKLMSDTLNNSYVNEPLVVRSLDIVPPQNQYCVVVDIGTPPVPFELVVDTGSADIWVQGSNCPDCAHSGNVFQTSKSSTFRNECRDIGDDCRFVNKYGSGTSYGIVGQDRISIGGILVAEDVQFGITNDESGDISQVLKGSGILGLGFQALAQYTSPTLVSYLSSFALELTATSGTLSLNGILPKYNSERYRWVSIPVEKFNEEYDYWTVGLPELSINGEYLCGNGTRRCQAVIDSGTSMIAAPRRVWPKLQALLKRVGCDQLSSDSLFLCQPGKVPSITLLLGTDFGYSVTIAPESYSVSSRIYRGLEEVMLFESPLEMDLWILGDVFMTQFYTVFNITDRTIRLASDSIPFSGKKIPSNELPSVWDTFNDLTIERWLFIIFFFVFICTILYCSCMEVSRTIHSYQHKSKPYSDEQLLRHLLKDHHDQRYP